MAARAHPLRDLAAGVSVAVVALPLALAYGQSSGMGARAGLATAIIAGAVAAVFGGGALQVAGPTGAMSVVLVPIVHGYGLRGVWTVSVMAGVLLVVAAVTGVGRYVRCIPHAVVEGFAAGIATVIILEQVPPALGLHREHGEKAWRGAAHAVDRFMAAPHPAPLLLALGVAGLMLAGARYRPTWPFPLIGIAAAAAIAVAAHLPVARISAVPSGLPTPSLQFWDAADAVALMPSALAVAAIVALEGLLCAAVVDAMGVTGKTDPDRELFGQGIANALLPMFGGMPATATIARTAVNVRCGARSRLAALTHAAVLAAIVYAAAGLVSQIPAAALAGVMLAAALRMIKLASMAALVRTGRADAVVIAVTTVLTVAVNLITAVIAGITLAAIVALAAITATMRLESESPSLPVPPLHTTDSVPPARGRHGRHRKGAPLPAFNPVEQQAQSPPQPVAVYRLAGPLFFAATQTLRDRLAAIAPPRVVILRMAGITTLDATGAHALGEAITDLEHQGSTVILTELHPHYDQTLTTLGIAGHLRTAGHIQPTLSQALGHATALLNGRASDTRQSPVHVQARPPRENIALAPPARREWPI